LEDLVAVYLPTHRHVLGVAAYRARQAAPVLGHARLVVFGEDAEVERLVGAAAHASTAIAESHPGAGDGELDHTSSPLASASAVASSSSRPDSSPSSFRRSVSSSARPSAGDSGMPASTRSCPVISSRTPLRSARQRSTWSPGA